MIDIDHFKRVNDNYGHDVGDIILRGVAMKIKESVGNQHFVARWGGEEFVIVLPDTDTETSFSLAEKIRHSIAQTRFETANEIAVTISAGVGSQSKGEDFASCFKRVDTAMFDAKKAGRNCSVIADTQQPGQANHL